MNIRRLSTIVVGLALLLALSACEDSTTGTETPSEDASADTQLRDTDQEDTSSGESDAGDTGVEEMDAGDTRLADSSADADETGPPPPTITQLTIEPDTITETDTGMTDEFFEVTIDVSGFDSPISEVELSLTGEGRQAPDPSERTMTVNDNTITVSNIPYTWFTGLDAGSYGITATVTDESGVSITKEDLATVEVTN